MTAVEVETALVSPRASKFYYRKCVVVANVSWGMNLHECDLLALTGAGVAHEIEIKVSRADLIADAKKKHDHPGGKLIRCLWFAGPEELEADFIELAPERAGIIVVYRLVDTGVPTWRQRIVRAAQINKQARTWKDYEKFKLARLGTMRYWSRRDV